MTNRDRLNAMDNEQLGEFMENLLGDLPWCDPDKYGVVEKDGVRECVKWDCDACAAEWLGAEAKDG